MGRVLVEDGQVTRETRNQSYKEAQESGKINTRKQEAYEALKQHGPGTIREIHKAADTDAVHSSFQPRISEDLFNEGRAMPIGKKECSVTGETVTEWCAV